MICYIPPRRAAPYEPHEGRFAAEGGKSAESVRTWGDESAGGAPNGSAWYGLENGLISGLILGGLLIGYWSDVYIVGRIVLAFYGGLCNFDPRDTLRGLKLRNSVRKYVVFIYWK